MSRKGLVLPSLPPKGERGFTVLELLLVVVVLLILAGLMFGLMSFVESARVTDTESRVFGLGLEVRKYQGVKGVPPAKLEDLAAKLDQPGWMKDGKFVDSWERPIQYEVSGNQFKLWSCGPDGKSGTGDDVKYLNK